MDHPRVGGVRLMNLMGALYFSEMSTFLGHDIYQTRAKPGAALQSPMSLIHSLVVNSLTHPLVKISLLRRHTLMGLPVIT